MSTSSERSPARRNVFIDHAYPEKSVNLGEVTMNYVVSGDAAKPALLLIPGQGESWWGYEKAIGLLDKDFQLYAVDLRGQGRSTWTPKRYTFDNMGNDLVRFIALVIKRPVITSGCSSGGVLSAWLNAFAMPGQIRGSCLEDPPLFASETNPICGQSIRQSAGPLWENLSKYLGDQWSVGDWPGFVAAIKQSIPMFPASPEPMQNFMEYDAEWARAFHEGTVAKNCPHELMLAQVKAPIFVTHHMHAEDPQTGRLFGALSDLQLAKAREIITAAGQPFEAVSFPDAMHIMHMTDPPRFADALSSWARTLPG